jgi:hypothetical protein
MTFERLKKEVQKYTDRHGSHPTVLKLRVKELTELLVDVSNIERYYTVLKIRIDNRLKKKWELSDDFYSGEIK